MCSDRENGVVKKKIKKKRKIKKEFKNNVIVI